MGSWQLSLRADRPVEGCEVTALAYLYQKALKKKNGVVLETPMPPPPPTSEYELRFRWIRGPEAPTCCYDGCPIARNFSPAVWSSFSRKNEMTLQCTDEAMRRKMAIGRHSVFCGAPCFRRAWQRSMTHKSTGPDVPVQRATTKRGATRRAGASDDADFHEHQRPRDDSVDEDPTEWVEVCTDRVFSPGPRDVGRRFRLECSAVRHDGTLLFGPRAIRIEPVLAAPPAPPTMKMIQTNAPVPNGGLRLRVVTYNILAEIYATQQAYPYCDFWALGWGYRCQSIVTQLLASQGDIICLQEMQADHYEKHIKPRMAEHGYDSLHKAKTRESMGMPGKIDGCAVFWRRNKVRLVENYGVEFDELARTFVQSLGQGDMQNREMLNRLLKNNIAMLMVFESIHTRGGSRSPPPQFCVANTHLYSNKDFPDVKLWQCERLVRELEALVIPRDLPLILCGDFNSVPSSAVYEYLSTQTVQPMHGDLKEDVAHILPPQSELMHNLRLSSSHASITGAEPKFTNYVQHFQGVLDYVWVSDHVRPAAVSQNPSEDELLRLGHALPNVVYSSDHLPMIVDIQMGGGGNGGAHHRSGSSGGQNVPGHHSGSSRRGGSRR